MTPLIAIFRAYVVLYVKTTSVGSEEKSPATFSLAAERIPGGGTVMFALLALFGDLGCTTGPATVGRLTTLFGGELSAGLIFAAAFPIMLVITLLVVGKREK